MPNVKVSQKNSASALSSRLTKLTRTEVTVGWGADNSSRPGESVTNAEVAYLTTNGSPLHNTPPRPILAPALSRQDNKELYTAELALAAKAALQGEEAQAGIHLERAGILATNAVKRYFEPGENDWAPNAPSTVASKKSSTPNIDLGELRRSVDSFVREK